MVLKTTVEKVKTPLQTTSFRFPGDNLLPGTFSFRFIICQDFKSYTEVVGYPDIRFYFVVVIATTGFLLPTFFLNQTVNLAPYSWVPNEEIVSKILKTTSTAV